MIRPFLDAWNDPAMRHAMLVHFPIVLSVVGVPVLLAAALVARFRAPLRVAALAIYVLLAGSALAARASGLRADQAVSGALDDQGQALLEEHEELGLWVWVIGGAVAALTGASFARHPALRLAAAWTAAAGGIFAAGWIASTADHGGRLVYRHGAGTPGAAAGKPRAGAPGASAGDPRIAFFSEQVRPLLVNNCLRCHNPQRARKAGGLDQTTIAGLLTGGMSGPALVPGRPQESLLIQAVTWQDPDLEMPKGKDKLPDDQIAVLEKWIADGAVWEPFVYEAPARTD